MATEKVERILNMAKELTQTEVAELFRELDKEFRKKSVFVAPKPAILGVFSKK